MQETEEEITMQLNGMTSKITSNADKLGAIVGLTTAGAGVEAISDSITRALTGHVHLPNLEDTLNSAYPYVKQAAKIWIAGLAIDELGVPMIGKYGKVIQKAAVGYGAGAFAHYLIYNSTHADEGSNPVSPQPYSNGGGSTVQPVSYPY